MKTKTFFLIIFFAINTFSQSIIKKIYTDKDIYSYGETVLITIRAINTSLLEDTLVFLTSCEAYPYLDGNSYIAFFDLGCWQVITQRIIQAQDSVEWIFKYPHSSNPGLLLSPGQHTVFGSFGKNYPTSDTITFYVKEATTAVEKEPTICIYKLGQNYPNPFNPTTTIPFNIEKESFVTLIIYNLLGKELRTLLKNNYKPGYHEVYWDGTNSVGEILPSGIYLYSLESEAYFSVKKMIILR